EGRAGSVGRAVDTTINLPLVRIRLTGSLGPAYLDSVRRAGDHYDGGLIAGGHSTFLTVVDSRHAVDIAGIGHRAAAVEGSSRDRLGGVRHSAGQVVLHWQVKLLVALQGHCKDEVLCGLSRCL